MPAFLRPVAPLLVTFVLAACGGHVGGATQEDHGGSTATCPPPSPGQCLPSAGCVDGVRRTGSASCVDGSWACEELACSADAGAIVADDAGTDGPACDKGTIEASHYDQSCATDADCTAVFEGSLCGHCLCANAAISQAALSSYQSDLQAAGPPVNVCACKMIPAPVCKSGTCALP